MNVLYFSLSSILITIMSIYQAKEKANEADEASLPGIFGNRSLKSQIAGLHFMHDISAHMGWQCEFFFPQCE
jgi:hypothetical protein